MRRWLLIAFLLCAASAWATTCGKTAIGGTSNPLFNFEVAMQKCVPVTNSTITDAQMYAGGGGGSNMIVAAVYDSDGGGGKPGTLLCANTTGVAVPSSPAWNLITLSTPCTGVTLTGGHTYWIVENSSVGNINTYYDSGSTAYYYSKTCCSFDNPFNTSPSSAALDFSAYLDITSAGPPPAKHQSVVTTAEFFVTPSGTGPTPALGWSPSRAMVAGVLVGETSVEANVNAMISDGILAAAGGAPFYISIDATWATGRDGSHNLITNTGAYPSGMTSLANYIHGHGMKFLTYLAPGSIGCNSFPSDLGLYQTNDAVTVTGYGADGWKYDDCASLSGNLQAQTDYATSALAMKATGRQMYFDVSVADSGFSHYGSFGWASLVGGNDVWTSFDSGAMTFSILGTEIDAQISTGGICTPVSCASLNAPGRFNMIDLLGLCGDSSLTQTEAQANYALFAIFKSPLLVTGDFSSDVTCQAAPILTIASNSEVIAVNQDSLGQGPIRASQVSCGSSTCDVYAVQLSGSAGNASYAVVAWNRASTTQNITVTFSTLPGSPVSSYYVRDLIAHSNLLGSAATTTYTFPNIASHGVAVGTLCTSQCSAL